MNDVGMMRAIRKLPAAYVLPGVNVTRFGEGAEGSIVASHAASRGQLPTLVYRDGRWEKDNPHGPVRRR